MSVLPVALVLVAAAGAVGAATAIDLRGIVEVGVDEETVARIGGVELSTAWQTLAWERARGRAKRSPLSFAKVYQRRLSTRDVQSENTMTCACIRAFVALWMLSLLHEAQEHT